jgi:hypothetical protein
MMRDQDQIQHQSHRTQSGASPMHRNLAILMRAPKAAHQSSQQAPQLCAKSEPQSKTTNKPLF